MRPNEYESACMISIKACGHSTLDNLVSLRFTDEVSCSEFTVISCENGELSFNPMQVTEQGFEEKCEVNNMRFKLLKSIETKHPAL